MAFDSFTLRRLVMELQPLVGQQWRHVAQLNDHEMVVKIGGHALLISAHPVHARCHLIDRMPKIKERSHLASFLMTHLSKATVTAIRQDGLDRVLHLDLMPQGEIIRKTPKRLICEFMGKHSNIILVDAETGRILESIKHIDASLSSYREVVPGEKYVPPPRREKTDPFAITRDRFMELLGDEREISWRLLMDTFDGFSPIIAREVIYRGGDSPDGLWRAMRSVVEEMTNDRRCFLFVAHDGKPIAVSPVRLRQFDLESVTVTAFDSISKALDKFHSDLMERERFIHAKHDLIQKLTKRIDSINEKLLRLYEQKSEAENADEFRIKGELILTNMNRIERGMSQVEVEDYYRSPPDKMIIDLAPELSPSDNAQRYFARYAKAKRARAKLANLIEDEESTLVLISDILAEVEAVESFSELDALKQEIVKRGWIELDQTSPRKQKVRESQPFRRYESVDGFEIIVGRNNKENDQLTMRYASKNDIWLHAKSIQGSHVVIRNPENRDVPMSTLLHAACLAAYYSRAKHSSHVPVDYTQIRYVVKPRGAKEGFVVYTHEKTLFVEPCIPSHRKKNEE